MRIFKTNNFRILHDEHGVSLLELILVMVMVGIISGFIASLLYYEITIYNRLVGMTGSTQITRNTLQMLSRDLRHIGAPDSIYQASGDSIRFDDIDDVMLSYKFSNDKIYRNSDLVQEGITDLTFQYFDNSGNVLSVPVNNPAEIQAIAVELVATVNGQALTYNTTIQPRNFK